MNAQARFPIRLGVIGHVPHWVGPDGLPWAYEPYVREMRIWADLFSEVVICSPAGEGPMVRNQAPYLRDNVVWRPVPYSLASGPGGSRKRLFQIPGLIRHARRTIRDTDFILLRSPGHFGLVGAALARAMKMPSITKWAGENGPYEGERFPSRVDRRLQLQPNDRHPVLVYGPPKASHQISFLPALMSGDELANARRIASGKTWTPPWRILSVGSLLAVKGFDLAIRGLAELRRIAPDLAWTYTLVGDGPEATALRDLAHASGIADCVTFTGSLPFADVQHHYGASHVVIMPGTKEGWPKVIAEAWAHGAIPVGASAGLVPCILGSENSGAVFQPTPGALAAALARLLRDSGAMAAMSRKLFGFAAQMSLEEFQSRLEVVLRERCGLKQAVLGSS